MSNTLVRVAYVLGYHEGVNLEFPPFCETPWAETLLCTQIADWIDANVDLGVSTKSLDAVVSNVLDHLIEKNPDGVREMPLVNDPSWVATHLKKLPREAIGLPPPGLAELWKDVLLIEARLNNPKDPQPPTGDDYNELHAAVVHALKAFKP